VAETHVVSTSLRIIMRAGAPILQQLWIPIERPGFYADPAATDEDNDMMYAEWRDAGQVKPEWRDVPIHRGDA